MPVCFWTPLKFRPPSCSLPASFNISPIDIVANPELACRGSRPLRSSPASPPFPPPPEHNIHLTSQNCWSHFDYVENSKTSWYYCFCVCGCACVRACLGTRHLSERHSAICHSDTQTVAHILTPRANRPHPPPLLCAPGSHPLLPSRIPSGSLSGS